MVATESCKPAPYGRACLGCSRAKCKCFHRSDGQGCERCHRLGKQCEPSVNVRQRRGARTGGGGTGSTTSSSASSKASHVHAHAQAHAPPVPSAADGQTMGNPSQHERPSPSKRKPRQHSPPPALPEPDVAVDTDLGMVYFLPVRSSPSPLHEDVSIHRVPMAEAQRRMDVFRTDILSFTPFVHIPHTMSPSELLRQKPALWLMIMALSTNDIGEQFRMEGTMWHIISRRTIIEHYADMDLLQALICFGIWSIYFKQDKFFIGMITQVAIAMAHQLHIHTDIPSSVEVCQRKSTSSTLAARANRTLEERRTFLALFHLSSSSWYAEKKMPPMQWTAYLDTCLRIVEEAAEAPWDVLLVLQVKCFNVENGVTCPSPMDGFEQAIKPKPASTVAALQAQLDEVKRNIPVHIRSMSSTQLFLEHTQLKLHEASFSRPLVPDSTGHNQLHRLQALESALACLERFFEALFSMPVGGWRGFSVQMFSQLMHCIVVLYKLMVIDEPCWDVDEVRRRADVFEILDRLTSLVAPVIQELGLVDAPGPRTGVLYKGTRTFQLIKQFLAARLPPSQGGPEGPTPPTVQVPMTAPMPGNGQGGGGANSHMFENGLHDPGFIGPGGGGAGNGGTDSNGIAIGGMPEDVYRRMLFEEAWATDIFNWGCDFPMQDANGYPGA